MGDNSMPRYQKIALDIANAIYKGDIKEGDRLHGRSTLAGRYGVSPETIRRSIKLLEDVEVVQSTKGSGITVLSREKAFIYINKFKNMESINDHKNNLRALINKKTELEGEMLRVIDKIVDYSGRLSNIKSIRPMEIELPSHSHVIGKTISDVKFWQHTGATIVGIIRGGTVLLSPGPYAVFEEGDIVLFIGEEKVYDSVKLLVDNY